MNRFRNRRDPEGKFALTTPQNPDLNQLPGLSPAQVNQQLLDIRRRADALHAADLAALAQLALDATAAAATEPESEAPVPAISSKSRESHTPHAPFAHALAVDGGDQIAAVPPGAAASAPEVSAEPSALEPQIGAPAPSSAPTSAPHPKAGAEASAPEPKDGAEAPTATSRESRMPHAPFASASAGDEGRDAVRLAAPCETASESEVSAEAPTSKSRESCTSHAPFAHAFSDAASAPDAASELNSAAPELASAPSATSRESRTPHAPFAHAFSDVASAPDAASELNSAAPELASVPSATSRESHTPHVPFAHPPSPAATPEPAAPPLPVYTEPESFLARHARKCSICNHPDRAEIEFDFTHWLRPANIVHNYELNNARALRRHALATGLDAVRRRNVRCALELIIEEADNAEQPSSDTVIRAVRAFTRINDQGAWQNPPTHVIVSSGTQLNLRNDLNLSIQNSTPQQQTTLDSQNGNTTINIESTTESSSPPDHF